MKKIFNAEFLKENSGCYKETEGKLKGVFLSNGKTCFEEAGECQITLEEIMSSNIPMDDKYWFLANKVLDLEERKELFLLVMHAVSEATEYITVKEYIDTLIRYANKEVDYTYLYDVYFRTHRVDWWVINSYNFISPWSNLGSGLYSIYDILHYLNRDKSTRDLVWEIVNEYINKNSPINGG